MEDLTSQHSLQRTFHETVKKIKEQSLSVRYIGESAISETNIETEYNNHCNNDRLLERYTDFHINSVALLYLTKLNDII